MSKDVEFVVSRATWCDDFDEVIFPLSLIFIWSYFFQYANLAFLWEKVGICCRCGFVSKRQLLTRHGFRLFG